MSTLVHGNMKGEDGARKRSRVDPFFGVLIAIIVMAGLAGILWVPVQPPTPDRYEQGISIEREGPTIRAADSILTDVRSRRALARRDAELMEERARHIGGLAPEDVVDGLRHRSFKIDTLPAQDGMKAWQCTREDIGAVYTVKVASDAEDKVNEIEAGVRADHVFKNVQATQDFFEFFVRLPYDDASPKEAEAWVNSYNGKGARMREFGNTRIELSAPDRRSRHLRMAPIPLEEQLRAYK